MKILILLAALIGFHCANAQDSLQSHIEDGKFYGIFPVSGDHVAYSESIAIPGSPGKDSLYYKAISFFDKNEDAKYYFESEDMGAGELIYQGKLRKSVISEKSDVHFTVVLHFTGDSCQFKLFEVVVASKAKYKQGTTYYGEQRPVGTGVPTYVAADVWTSAGVKTKDRTTLLENITIDKDEFSRQYCEKINKRLLHIMDAISGAFR